MAKLLTPERVTLTKFKAALSYGLHDTEAKAIAADLITAMNYLGTKPSATIFGELFDTESRACDCVRYMMLVNEIMSMTGVTQEQLREAFLNADD